MFPGNKTTLFLTLTLVAAVCFFAFDGLRTDQDRDDHRPTASDPNPSASETKTEGKILMRARSERELKEFREAMLRNLHRIAMFDPSMSDEELSEFENQMAAAAMYDANARAMMIDVLNDSFTKKDRSSIYFLDRVLRVSDPGRKVLVDNYTKMVIEDSQDDFFALQGVHNHASGEVPEKDMGILFDKALGQLDKYDTFARYSPAMIFAATAIGNGSFKATDAQRSALRNRIEMHQADAKTHQDFFFSAQSLITMSDLTQRNAVAERLIEKYPHRGTFDAVLESIKIGEFEPSQRLMTSMETVARRLAASNKS